MIYSSITWQPLSTYVWGGARLLNIHVHVQSRFFCSSCQIKYVSQPFLCYEPKQNEEQRGENSGKTGPISHMHCVYHLVFIQRTLPEVSQHPPCDKTDSSFVMEMLHHCTPSIISFYKVHVYIHVNCLLMLLFRAFKRIYGEAACLFCSNSAAQMSVGYDTFRIKTKQ